MDTVSFLLEAFSPVASRRILDVGCGGGQLARALSRHGANVTGIDPARPAIEAARQAAPGCRFEVASAENLPFANGSFDETVFLNSLHHLPRGAMPGAFREAARVTVPGGYVVIVEPLAEGSFFDAFRLIDDETEVRGHAQDALGAALLGAALRPVRSITYVRSESFTDFERFVDRAVAAEPERRAIVDRVRPELEAAFHRHSARSSDGLYRLDQPLKGDVLLVV